MMKTLAKWFEELYVKVCNDYIPITEDVSREPPSDYQTVNWILKKLQELQRISMNTKDITVECYHPQIWAFSVQ